MKNCIKTISTLTERIFKYNISDFLSLVKYIMKIILQHITSDHDSHATSPQSQRVNSDVLQNKVRTYSNQTRFDCKQNCIT